MLDAAGLKDADPAKALADGSAMDVWRRMIAAQGGDPDAELPTSKEQHVIKAGASGVLTRLDAYDIGVAAWRLGAGRARKEDPVQAAAGVELHAKPGDTVTAGQPSSPCTRTPRTASSTRWRRCRARTTWPRRARPSPPRRWCGNVSPDPWRPGQPGRRAAARRPDVRQ